MATGVVAFIAALLFSPPVVTPPKSAVTPRRLGLGLLTLGAGGLVVAAVVIYLQREAIGVRLAFDYLKAHGVPAAIRLDRLDLGGVAGQVRLGARAHPDLTVGRVEAQFGAPPFSWRGVQPPPVRVLTLVQPVLHGRWRDGRLDFGTLQPLIDQALAAKPSGAPSPDLYIRDGRVDLDTPSGPLLLAVDAAVQAGRIRMLHVRLAPADLRAFGVHVSDVQGVLSGEATGRGGLHLTGAFAAARGQGREGAATGLTLTVEALTPNGAPSRAGSATRPLDAIIRLKAPHFALTPDSGPPVDIRRADVAVNVEGLVDASGGFMGRLRTLGRAGRVTRAGLELASDALDLQSSDAEVRMHAGEAIARGPFTLTISSAAGRLGVGRTQATLQTLSLRSVGDLTLQGRRLLVQAGGDLAGTAGLSLSQAAELAHGVVGSADAAAGQALARALQRVRASIPAYALSYDSRRGTTLRLSKGLTAVVPGGSIGLASSAATPVLDRTSSGDLSGRFGLAVRVAGLPRLSLQDARYDVSAGGDVRLAGRASVQGDFGPVRGGALQVAGALAGRPDRWRFTEAGCAHVAALAVLSGAQGLASGLTADACPDPDAPLASLDRGRWRIRTRLHQLSAALPAAQLAVRLADADIALDEDRRGPEGRLMLAGLAMLDTAPVLRLRPVTVQGALTLAGGELHGRLAVALTQADPRRSATGLGALTVETKLATGAGSASFDSGRLAFVQGGLQPGDIAPGLTRVLPQAQGGLQALARFDWSRAGVVSSGELRSDGLSFKSPAGRLDGLKGEVRLASLSPLLSAPDQTLTADTLETVAPLEHLRIGFTLGAQALELQAASAQVAAGTVSLDAMRLPLSGPLATRGVLRLQGVDLQQLIDALNLANAVSLQARVDGALPFSLQPAAGGATALRLAQGRVYAVAPGRLTIRRQALSGAVATAGGGAQPSAVQDFAYQALEDLAFSQLEATVASRPGGRLGLVFHVVGRHDPKLDRPTRIGLFALLRGHAFDKPLPLPKGTPVNLTLDTSLNLDDILTAYGAFGAASGSVKVQP